MLLDDRCDFRFRSMRQRKVNAVCLRATKRSFTAAGIIEWGKDRRRSYII